ncbi:mysoin-binding motif of peroxisomes domain-containing protein [Sarocladium implicatum]|nr:mysoin-binding motif of peroxisomes domain-containing protein [Sarocladium implicatum]
MEPVVYEETPLADYLRDGGHDSGEDWAPVHETPPAPDSGRSSPSLPSSPTTGFAPVGRPLVKTRFRGKPKPLHLETTSVPDSFRAINRTYSAAVAASLDRGDTARFLEQFRYTIVASQLLNGHSLLGQAQPPPIDLPPVTDQADKSLLSIEGIFASVLGALGVAVVLSWVLGSAPSYVTRKRLIFLVVLLVAAVLLGQVYMRRQWLRYRRQQSLTEVRAFVSHAQDFDSAAGAALSLIQEVELVSRGYRISLPLPPISRLEDRSQSRKCVRLRKTLKATFADMLQTYNQVARVIRGFAEQSDLEKYYDIYDVSDFDMSDAFRGFDETEFDDFESLRTLKILAARFQVLRKLFLCGLLALDACGDETDLLRWTTAVEALRNVNETTQKTYTRLQDILREEESFPTPPTPKNPLSPGRERWRSQMHKLNTLSTGIRGLQAKLQLLREESDHALDDSTDISELGPNLMSQYESIGVDLKELMAAWEEGKAALAIGIDRNEKRLSSMSTLLSPTTSLSGLTAVEHSGTAADALKALTGQSPTPSEMNEETPEIFEAVSNPRPRSMLSREERLIKMREDREVKAQARQQIDATKGMLRELETVINLRPRKRQSLNSASNPSTPGGRITSL